jgi:hypothetical protein
VRGGGEHDPLAEAALVINLLLLVTRHAVHHQDDPERRTSEVLGITLDVGQCPPRGGIADDDQLPRLTVAGAAGPARHIENIIERPLRHRLRAELADSAQATEEGNAIVSGGIGHQRPLLH